MPAFILTILAILFFNSGIALGDYKVINGTPVESGDYPEIIHIMSNDGNRYISCSASIIGPKTILTAAHCLMPDKKITFNFNSEFYSADCEAHPLYPDIEDMDMALCKTHDKKIKTKYAHIAYTGPKLDEIVTLTGFGCTHPERWPDGILRHGEAPVVGLPTSDPTYNWYFTVADVTLCFGDSGGPGYIRLTDPSNQVHYVIGVNSRGNLKNRSLMTAIYMKKSRDWMVKYAIQENVRICGINVTCQL